MCTTELQLAFKTKRNRSELARSLGATDKSASPESKFWAKIQVMAQEQIEANPQLAIAQAQSRARALQDAQKHGYKLKPLPGHEEDEEVPIEMVDVWRGANSSWVTLPVHCLVPGDLVSLSSGSGGGGGSGGGVSDNAGNSSTTVNASASASTKTSIIPADCVVLQGSALVDEAALTGESVPQIKTALCPSSSNSGGRGATAERLDMAGRHNSHVLFAGTQFLQHSSENDSASGSGSGSGSGGPGGDRIQSKNGGVVCYVLRTGWHSTRGELLRMVTAKDDSSGSVAPERARRREGKRILSVLLTAGVFAAARAVMPDVKALLNPSSVVTAVGAAVGSAAEANAETTWVKVAVKAARVLMSVVPSDLSSTSDLALERLSKSLRKAHAVACTEEWRLPMAGLVSTCLLDKTGTLTTDKFITEGVVIPHQPAEEAESLLTSASKLLAPKEVGSVALGVLAGCHGLSANSGDNDSVDSHKHAGNESHLIGDPLELSAVSAIGWKFDPATGICQPKEASASGGHRGRSTGHGRTVVRVRQRQRFPFSAELRRMSVIADITWAGPKDAEGGSEELTERWVLVKGSPEAVAALLDGESGEGGNPGGAQEGVYGQGGEWYDAIAEALGLSGGRVLALAGRPLTQEELDADDRSDASGRGGEASPLQRHLLERSLLFAGFGVFKSQLRADALSTVGALAAADVQVGMLTGDAVTTAVHTAWQAGIRPLGQTNFTGLVFDDFALNGLKNRSTELEALELRMNETASSMLDELDRWNDDDEHVDEARLPPLWWHDIHTGEALEVRFTQI